MAAGRPVTALEAVMSVAGKDSGTEILPALVIRQTLPINAQSVCILMPWWGQVTFPVLRQYSNMVLYFIAGQVLYCLADGPEFLLADLCGLVAPATSPVLWSLALLRFLPAQLRWHTHR